MNLHKILLAAILGLVPFASSLAAETAAPAPEMHGLTHDKHADHSKHGKRCGMHGGMKCRHKMHGMPLMIPQLPPGNEKLQLQMQAEIMRTVGDITAKYAAQLK